MVTDYLFAVVARDVTEIQQVVATLATGGGQRLVAYLRLAEVKLPSSLPPTPASVASGQSVSRHRGTEGPTGLSR